MFRLEPDKRPQLFIKLAALYLKERPQARFFLVGDGRLRENIEALAQEHDVLDRLLLVGLSNHVGFWYSKMDASVLLSRYEGLPNVLIEAQLLGVPVISTPAGGAEECFVEDETGHLLSDVDHPDMHEAYKKVLNMVDQVRSNADLRAHSRQRAQKLFSLDAMLTKFMSICMPAMTESQNDERIDVAPQRRMLA